MDLTFFQWVIIVTVGALGSVLVNRGVAVFNDGLRPIMPEYLEGRMTRGELAATSFALSFGLIIGFGIPLSIGAAIMIGHSILLACDMIGIWSPKSKIGLIIAGVIGAIYSIGLVLGLQFVVRVFQMLPVNFLDSLNLIGQPIIIAFTVFPAIAVGYQHGLKKAATTAIVTLICLLLFKKFGAFEIAGYNIVLSPEGIALLAGMIMMIYYAARMKAEDTSTNADLVNIFNERVNRIKKNRWLLALMGGLISLTSSMLILAVDAMPQALINQGLYTEAAIATFARAIGFVPLVFSTAIVTGVYGLAGTTLVFAIGLIFRDIPILAFILGAVVMYLEVISLSAVSKSMDKLPGVREMGEHIRTSLSDVLGMAILIGSAMAAAKIAPEIGFFWVLGFYLINRIAKKPLVELAVGPIAVILLGIMINLLNVIGLWPEG
ncbi:YhfT family protein [Bacillus sp. CLL-7-23]|uniref:YhfT family protein n=1 Tax=Bacillus changyiensis TaxID=3004103 RepID=A0ABT4X5Z6_9BACI|nr:YhfT family protein [Bacillus changyiensis]MDA7026782.1 YhfT family protein [Bacillus changyiensis]